MIGILGILFLLVASSSSRPLESWEDSKFLKDHHSWRVVKNSAPNNWEDRLDEETETSFPNQNSLIWRDETGLEHKGWDSFSDITLSVEKKNSWNRRKRSPEKSETGAPVFALKDEYRQKPGTESMDTAEVNAIFMPAKFRLKKKAAHNLCRRMLKLYEIEERRISKSAGLSRALRLPEPLSNRILYSWSCNDFCCYPALH